MILVSIIYTLVIKIKTRRYNLTHISIQTSPLHKHQKIGELLPVLHISSSVSSAVKILVSNKRDIYFAQKPLDGGWGKTLILHNLTKSYIHIVQCQFSQIDRTRGLDSNPSGRDLREMDALQLHKHMLLSEEEYWSLLSSYFP